MNSTLLENLNDYLIHIGLPKGLSEPLSLYKKNKVAQWISIGTSKEDTSTRWLNHFHHPLKDWSEAGYKEAFFDKIPFGKEVQSSVIWSQDPENQAKWSEGDQTWQAARRFYLQALCARNSTAREESFARMFKALGHQLHLVQDKAVPAHVRDDGHPEGNFPGFDLRFGDRYFERWANDRLDLIAALSQDPTFPCLDLQVNTDGLAPITQFSDTNAYLAEDPDTFIRMGMASGPASLTTGLAEYTNANFFSDGTIHLKRHADFPYPNQASTNVLEFVNQGLLPKVRVAFDGQAETTFYISKVADGEYIEHFLKPGYFSIPIAQIPFSQNLLFRTFYRDETCHEDYASLLVPRAVGYSAALLDYFFRGRIALAHPDQENATTLMDPFVVHTPPRPGLIQLQAKNNSTIPKAMSSGDIQLIVHYSEPGTPDKEFAFLSAPEVNGLSMLTEDSPAQLEFDLSDTPISDHATDVRFYVVYNGDLGQERGAAAVGSIEGQPCNHIRMTLPEVGFYSLCTLDDQSIDPRSEGFDRIILQAGMPWQGAGLSNGTIELLVKYKVSPGDPFQDYTDSVDHEFQHILVPERNAVSALPPDGTPVLLDFDLSERHLPLWATDVHFYLLFSRDQGQGVRTEAWGYLDPSEPTPLLVFNNLDRACLSGGWHVAGTPGAVAQVDKNDNGIADPWEFDVYPDNLLNTRVRLSPSYSPQMPAGDAKDILIERLNAGESFRFYTITDPRFTVATNRPSLEHAHPDDAFATTSLPAQARILPGREHQTEPLDPEVCLKYGQQPPCYGAIYGQTATLRDEMFFHLLLFSKPSHPRNKSCPLNALN